MTDQRSANAENDQTHVKRDGKVRRAIRKILKPKNWADDVIGRPVEVIDQIEDARRPINPKV